MKLLEDRVAIKRDDGTKKSKGGIVFAGEQRVLTGVVTHIGPGKFNPDVYDDYEPMTVAPGDKVLAPYQGIEFEHNGEELEIFRENEIVAIL